MSETLVRLGYFAVVCLISSYYLVCYYGVILILYNIIIVVISVIPIELF